MAAIIKAQAGALVSSLGLAALPVRERQTQRIPVLEAVHLAAGDDGLSVTATSFHGTITTRLKAEAEGEAAVPLERLAALVAHFPADAEIAINADDRAATVTSGKSRFRLPVFPVADLLKRHVIGKETQTGRVELEAAIARDLFCRPAFAVSTEKSRLYLNGIFLHTIGDDLVAVATDGHRLCRVTAPATTSLSTDRALIISNEMVKTIGRLLGKTASKVTLRRSDRLFAVETTRFTVVSARIDATYPEYERLISFEAPNVVTTSRTRLSESLARFAAVADPRSQTHVVSLRWDANGLHLSTPDSCADCLVADVEGEGETAAQIRHLAELIGALRGDSVRIGAGKPDSFILITDPEDGNFFAVQMPWRPRSS